MRPIVLAGLLLASFATTRAPAMEQKDLASMEAALQAGRLAEAERVVGDALKAKPGDDEARFGLGLVQFLRAVEGRMQALHRHGFRSEQGQLISNLPIPRNAKPEPLDYKSARGLLQSWIDDLARVEATLIPIQSPDVKLPIHFGLIRLDFLGDGKSMVEPLWKVYGQFNQRTRVSEEAARGFVITIDRGDVDWLRGYCHLLSAITEAWLAHDFEAVFNQSGFLFFAGIKIPDGFERSGVDEDLVGNILDFVAMIHQAHLPVAEPDRLKATLKHLETTVALSRSSWKFILAETDDDNEWIPNPKQHTVVPNSQMNDERIKGWFRFLDEFEAILQGTKLVPFWRGKDKTRGVNVRRVLSEPRPFDLVYWIQGVAALPYLDHGDVSSPETWSQLNRIFQGEFVGFAFWIN